jgi:hypothetical protein
VGHQWPDIQDYTLSQIREFSKGAVRFYEIQNASALSTTAMGAQGKGEDIEKAIGRLLGRE